MSRYHFALRWDENGNEYIESDMHCKIGNDDSQLLIWTEYFPTADKWIYGEDLLLTPQQARASGNHGVCDPLRCGWFPIPPVNWCCDVFGASQHEYSNFLSPSSAVLAQAINRKPR
jgi:hypothetical protein